MAARRIDPVMVKEGNNSAVASIIEMLECDGVPPLIGPTWSDVQQALAELGPGSRGYVILTASDGSYIQAAGSHDRLTIEYRQMIGSRHNHFVLGNRTRDGRTARIDTSIGGIEVERSEVLTLADATRVCRAFFETGVVPDAYALRRMS